MSHEQLNNGTQQTPGNGEALSPIARFQQRFEQEGKGEDAADRAVKRLAEEGKISVAQAADTIFGPQEYPVIPQEPSADVIVVNPQEGNDPNKEKPKDYSKMVTPNYTRLPLPEASRLARGVMGVVAGTLVTGDMVGRAVKGANASIDLYDIAQELGIRQARAELEETANDLVAQITPEERKKLKEEAAEQGLNIDDLNNAQKVELSNLYAKGKDLIVRVIGGVREVVAQRQLNEVQAERNRAERDKLLNGVDRATSLGMAGGAFVTGGATSFLAGAAHGLIKGPAKVPPVGFAVGATEGIVGVIGTPLAGERFINALHYAERINWQDLGENTALVAVGVSLTIIGCATLIETVKNLRDVKVETVPVEVKDNTHRRN